MPKKLLLSDIDLQRFADENTADTDNADAANDGTETSKNTGDDNDQKDFVKMTQKEFDDILTKRLERQEAKLIEKFEKDREEEIRKSKLSQAEREQEALHELQEELNAQKAENKRMKLENTTSNLLTEAELPQSFKSFLMGADEESTKANINAFKESYEADIKRVTEEKRKNKAPGTSKEKVNPDETVWTNIVNKYK